MELLPQALIDGIMLGAIYINIAIAFSLVYGVLHIIDFAVGEWIMLGAFTGYHLTLLTHVEPFLLLPIIFVIFAGLGLLLQPLIQRVLSGHKGNPTPHGPGVHLRPGADGARPGPDLLRLLQPLHPVPFSAGSFFFRGASFFVTISSVRLLGLVYAVVLTLLLNLMLRKTDFGLAIRALAMQKEAAGLMGVNAKRTNRWLFAIYVGITAMTGVLIGVILSVASKMGPENSILAFFVVVLAGMGYLAGVPAAAFLLGIIQSIFLVYLDPGYTMMAVFGILYLILLVSPTGMFRRGM